MLFAQVQSNVEVKQQWVYASSATNSRKLSPALAKAKASLLSKQTQLYKLNAVRGLTLLLCCTAQHSHLPPGGQRGRPATADCLKGSLQRHTGIQCFARPPRLRAYLRIGCTERQRACHDGGAVQVPAVDAIYKQLLRVSNEEIVQKVAKLLPHPPQMVLYRVCRFGVCPLDLPMSKASWPLQQPKNEPDITHHTIHAVGTHQAYSAFLKNLLDSTTILHMKMKGSEHSARRQCARSTFKASLQHAPVLARCLRQVAPPLLPQAPYPPAHPLQRPVHATSA